MVRAPYERGLGIFFFYKKHTIIGNGLFWWQEKGFEIKNFFFFLFNCPIVFKLCWDSYKFACLGGYRKGSPVIPNTVRDLGKLMHKDLQIYISEVVVPILLLPSQ